MDLRAKLHTSFYDIFLLIFWRKSYQKKVIKLQSLEFSISDTIPTNVQNISLLVFFAFFVSFMEKKPPLKFIGVFVHFLRTYEVPKFSMIKSYLDISDVIRVYEHSKYAYCGLHVNFWIFC